MNTLRRELTASHHITQRRISRGQAIRERRHRRGHRHLPRDDPESSDFARKYYVMGLRRVDGEELRVNSAIIGVDVLAGRWAGPPRRARASESAVLRLKSPAGAALRFDHTYTLFPSAGGGEGRGKKKFTLPQLCDIFLDLHPSSRFKFPNSRVELGPRFDLLRRLFFFGLFLDDRGSNTRRTRLSSHRCE